MTTYQDIQPKMMDVIQRSKSLAMMTRDELFSYVSELVELGDEINNFVRDIDLKIAQLEQEILERSRAEKMSATMAELQVRAVGKPYKADQEWANKQAKLLSELRISALAAQRGAE